MVEVVGCDSCGSPLSYGELFRHRVALEVSGGRRAARQILGDRLSPSVPLQLCGGCRAQAERSLPDLPRREAASQDEMRWVAPLLVAFTGALLVTAAIHLGRSRY